MICNIFTFLQCLGHVTKYDVLSTSILKRKKQKKPKKNFPVR